jgi:hypothetical protein
MRPATSYSYVRALIRKTDGAYELEVRRPGGAARARHHTLVAALNAEPELRQLWRPAPAGEAASDLGPGVLFVVPAAA